MLEGTLEESHTVFSHPKYEGCLEKIPVSIFNRVMAKY